MSDIEKRKAAYFDTLKWAISQTCFINIVFVDNSMFDFTEWRELYELSSYYNKKVEFLSFKGSESTQIQGKGYGEGEIIEYAFANSELLRKSNWFVKLTGRLKIKNIDKIFDEKAGEIEENTVVANLNFPYENMIDTRVYGMNCELYRNLFLKCYEDVNDFGGVYIEHLFYNAIVKNKDKINLRNTSAYPHYIGVNGTSGQSARRSVIFNYFADKLCRTNKFNKGGYYFKLLNIKHSVIVVIKRIIVKTS